MNASVGRVLVAFGVSLMLLAVVLGLGIALYLLLALILAMGPLAFGLILVGGAMFGLGFLLCLWLTFGAVWVKAEPTYWTTTIPTATSRTEPPR